MTFLKVTDGSENVTLALGCEVNTQQHGYRATNSLCANTCLQPEGRDAGSSRDGIVIVVFGRKVDSAVLPDRGFSVGVSASLMKLWMAVGYVGQGTVN